MKITSEWVNAYFDKGIDVVNRRVFLGEVTDNSVDAVVKGLYLMNEENGDEPIELFINSGGGCIYGTLAIHDICRTISAPVHSFSYGICMSSALLLLAMGETGYRWVSENSWMMHHAGATELEGKTGALQADMKHMIQLEKVWTELMTRYSSKTYKFWTDRANKQGDFYFTADEAIEWGLADAVWSER